MGGRSVRPGDRPSRGGSASCARGAATPGSRRRCRGGDRVPGRARWGRSMPIPIRSSRRRSAPSWPNRVPPCRARRAPSPRSVRQRRDRTGHCRSPGRPRNRWPRACPMPTGRGRSARSPTGSASRGGAPRGSVLRRARSTANLRFIGRKSSQGAAASCAAAPLRRSPLRTMHATVALARRSPGTPVTRCPVAAMTSRRVPRHRATRP